MTDSSLVLRISDATGSAAGFRQASLRISKGAEQLHACTVSVPDILDTSLRRELQWYLEEFPRSPFDPAPEVARRVARRLRHAGEELFTALLSSDNRGVVACYLREHLRSMRIEVEDDGAAATTWELLRDPQTGVLPVLACLAFVRRVATEPLTPIIWNASNATTRILLVVSRPDGPEDVPFQSIARPLLAALEALSHVEVSVLRPATWPQLLAVLGAAHASGKPFAIVHFDGHGRLEGGRGHLVFESEDVTHPAWIAGAVFGEN